MAVMGSVGLVGAGLATYFSCFRPWQLRWGATDQEAGRPMPGDEIVSRPTFNATRAVTINAPPDRIWPWLVQIGFGRAGWYSYDLLDNLGRHSSEHILADYQDLQPGDLVPLGPGEQGMRVKDFSPGEWMVWWDPEGQASTWVWGLYPVTDTQTRLITRVRNDYLASPSNLLFGLLLIEPADFPMMRKCLLGIKRRAESGVVSSQAAVETAPAK